jgi:hypothetical protein
MTIDTGYSTGCNEEFTELCALSTTGELSAEEIAALNEHVAGCDRCMALLREYEGLIHVGMTKLAADLVPDTEIEIPVAYDETKGATQFVSAFRAQQDTSRLRLYSLGNQIQHADGWKAIRRPTLLATAAALLLVCLGGVFNLGRRMNVAQLHSAPITVVHPPLVADGENAKLRRDLAAAQDSLNAAIEKSAKIQKQLEALSGAKTSLLTQIAELTNKDTVNSDSLTVVKQQRNALQNRLDDASKALALTHEELNRVQQDHQGALFRVATLETKIEDLHTQLTSTNNSAGTTEKFLAQDRDIRELMGARQLYIADVFDVQKNGDRSKPFGRVFYTRGKSLIFYAFDLEKQQGYKETKIFEAWGKPDSSSAKPISLGIFYMDNEQNRRWVVKSDNPEILAQINSVFVTVEPHGGSQNPTGKPFLEAYLHTLPPNHP